ncbi:MAG: lipoate--protein ligase family protein [Syntrophomonadaceae bacterium]
MDLYNLGAVTWWESQCYYHALAHLGREGLIICYPSSPYVCLGLHDDLEQEIDRGYCRRYGIPIFRRETGGGVVYLDSQQIFFQLVLRRDNPKLPLRRHRYYKKFLQPAIGVYRQYGVPAELKEPADIAAAGKKCSGNACGDVGECVAYVGNILLDFDFSTMSHLLRVPYNKFREYLLLAMRNNMTTLKDWTDYRVPYEELAAGLIKGFEIEWGELERKNVDEELQNKASEIYQYTQSSEWLMAPGRKYKERRVKIAEGVNLLEKIITQEMSAIILLRDGIVEELYAFGKHCNNVQLNYGLIGKKWTDDLLATICC